jgi:hypothetical protein
VELGGDHQSRLPVFQQEWWLSLIAQAPGFRENNVVRDNQIVARLPYFIRPPFGIRLGAYPWTSLAGPIVLASGLSKSDLDDVVTELADRIPPYVSVRFVFDSDHPAAALYREVFLRAGFSFDIEPNYREPPDHSDVFKRVIRRHKNPINKAIEHLEIVDVEPDFFTQFYTANLVARRISLRPNFHIAKALIFEGHKRQQVRIRAARSKTLNCLGKYDYHAAVAVVEDRTRVFGWMLSFRPNGYRGATRYLFLDAVTYAKKKCLAYDVNGAPSDTHRANYVEIIGVPQKVDRFVFERRNPINSAFQRSKRLLRTRGIWRAWSEAKLGLTHFL